MRINYKLSWVIITFACFISLPVYACIGCYEADMQEQYPYYMLFSMVYILWLMSEIAHFIAGEKMTKRTTEQKRIYIFIFFIVLFALCSFPEYGIIHILPIHNYETNEALYHFCNCLPIALLSIYILFDILFTLRKSTKPLRKKILLLSSDQKRYLIFLGIGLFFSVGWYFCIHSNYYLISRIKEYHYSSVFSKVIPELILNKGESCTGEVKNIITRRVGRKNSMRNQNTPFYILIKIEREKSFPFFERILKNQVLNQKTVIHSHSLENLILCAAEVGGKNASNILKQIFTKHLDDNYLRRCILIALLNTGDTESVKFVLEHLDLLLEEYQQDGFANEISVKGIINELFNSNDPLALRQSIKKYLFVGRWARLAYGNIEIATSEPLNLTCLIDNDYATLQAMDDKIDIDELRKQFEQNKKAIIDKWNFDRKPL